jgi:hypothetical protein
MMSRSILSRAFSRRSLDTSLANSAASEPDCRALAGLAASRIQRRNKLSWMPRSLATELTDIATWVASLTASDLNSGLNFLRNAICSISHVSFYFNKLDKSVRGNGETHIDQFSPRLTSVFISVLFNFKKYILI